MKYLVKDLIGGENGFTGEDGLRVYDAIFPHISSGEFVELDFAGTRLFLSVFFHYAIGQILFDVDPATFDRLLMVSNLSEVSRYTYKQVLAVAKPNAAFVWSDRPNQTEQAAIASTQDQAAHRTECL